MRHLKSCIRTPHHFIIILPIFLTFFCGWWTSEAISTTKNWRNEEERQLAAFLSFFLSFFLSDFLSFCFGLWKSVGNDKDQDILHLKTGQRHRGNPLTLVVFLHLLVPPFPSPLFYYPIQSQPSHPQLVPLNFLSRWPASPWWRCCWPWAPPPSTTSVWMSRELNYRWSQL